MPNFFRLAFMHVCVHMVWFSPILSILTAQATMILTMSEGRIARYKKGAKEDMILNNKTMIRCPCRTCKLQRWIDPESGQLEGHLLRRGFMRDLNEAPTGHGGGHEDVGGREDEESTGHDHHDEGDASEHDHHDEGDVGGHDQHGEGDGDGHDHDHEEGEDVNT